MIKKGISGSVFGALVVLLTFAGWNAYVKQEQHVQQVLEIKADAIRLHRTIDNLNVQSATLETARLESRMLYEEKQLSPADDQLQHWLDQTQDLIVAIHEKVEGKRENTKAFPNYPPKHYY